MQLGPVSSTALRLGLNAEESTGEDDVSRRLPESEMGGMTGVLTELSAQGGPPAPTPKVL